MLKVRKSMVRPPIRSIIHSLKLVDYFSVRANRALSLTKHLDIVNKDIENLKIYDVCSIQLF